jgi:protein-disulfide isomerase-like protein with CxxC motif
MSYIENLLKQAGISPRQRAVIVDGLRGEVGDVHAVSDAFYAEGKPRSSVVHRELGNVPGLTAEHRQAVVRHLASRGYLHDDGIESCMASVDISKNPTLFRRISAEAHRHGVELAPGQRITVRELDRMLAASNKANDPASRIDLKSNMARAGLLID